MARLLIHWRSEVRLPFRSPFSIRVWYLLTGSGLASRDRRHSADAMSGAFRLEQTFSTAAMRSTRQTDFIRGKSMAIRKTSGKSKRPVARGKAGRPPRQRHAQAHAAHRAKTAKRGATKSEQKWSHHVMETSDAMDIEHNIFKTGNAQSIADSLKRSSTQSRRRKGSPFQSAMSMLNFYINRAGRNLPKERRDTLQQAKRKLRELFGRAP